MIKLMERVTTLLVALSLVLSGIMPAAASAQSFNDILGRGGTRGETGARRMNAAQMRDAQAARAIFDRVNAGHADIAALPPSHSTETYNPKNPRRAAILKADLQKAALAYEPYRAAGTVPPTAVLVQMRDAVAPFIRFLDMMRQASGRAPPLMVAPGQTRTFDLPAYCMDSNLPAPKRGETFRMAPIASLLPPELAPVIRAMMTRAGPYDYQVQGLVWNLRDAYRNGAPLNLSADRLARLERDYPEAATAIAAYNRKASRAGAARGLMDSLIPGLRRNVSQIMDTAQGLSPAQIAQDVQTRLASLNRMPVAGDINPDAAYSTIAPGVAAYARSPEGGAHNAVITIANTTDQPYVLQQSEFVAQSERPVQHLALQLPPGFGGDTADAGTGFTLAQLATFGLDISAVGNIKALAQALLGYDLITGEPVNRWMQILFALPAIGQEMRLVAGAERAALRLAEREAAGGLRQAAHGAPHAPTGPPSTAVGNAATNLPSPWTLNPFKRGQEIEQRLGHNLEQNYPVIDRFNWGTGEATSIKSLDLGAKSYQSPAALERTIGKYVDSVAAYKGGAPWGQTPAINPSQVTSRSLDFVVPGMGSQGQEAAIRNAVTTAAGKGVKVNIIRMP